MEGSKKWYESRGMWGGLATLAAGIAGPAAGINVDAAMQGEAVDIIIGVIGIGGAIVALYGRVVASSRIG